MTEEVEIKEFYRSHADRITQKRAQSASTLRRYVHECQYKSVLRFVEPGMRVLDSGCGEGNLALMMAKKGAKVTACDISEPNIEQCKINAVQEGVEGIEFLTADSENLPFPEGSFDLVVSSHVLEHLPDFDKGLSEVMRVAKRRSVVAIPTALNLCSFVQLGGGTFWTARPRSFLAFFIGFLRVVLALITGQDGVDERYAGHDVPHVFRFPWVLRRKAKTVGIDVVTCEASTLSIPYFSILLPLDRALDSLRAKPFLRNFGYGTTYLLEKPTN